LQVYTRYELVGAGRGPGDTGETAHRSRVGGDRTRLLLEGSWPRPARSSADTALDEVIDARFGWIDWEVQRLAAAAGERPPAGWPVSPLWLGALGLRYHLVKLLRLVAYFTEVRPLGPEDRVWLHAVRDRDEDYAELLAAVCRRCGAEAAVRWSPRRGGETCGQRLRRGRKTYAELGAGPVNARWRRWLGRLAEWMGPADVGGSPRPKVVLCGNPRLLGPVCKTLLRRGASVWWLYDRFALKSWLRWRGRGVGQLVCDSSLGSDRTWAASELPRMESRGVDLRGPVMCWLDRRLAAQGGRQHRLVERIDSHFRRLRPDRLVVDEDATPMARAAVAAARRWGAVSLVVQHGVPATQFGFAPLAADYFLAWGESSRDQLEAWEVPGERIVVTGSPCHGGKKGSGTFCAKHPKGLSSKRFLPPFSSRKRSPTPDTVLLLATVPPRDERPDYVKLHMTGQSYRAMIEMALGAVSKLPAARLVVKLHPRSPEDPVVRGVLREYPRLEVKTIRRATLAKCLRGVDCVLSCMSSAGIEATLAGVPVIQLLPPRAGDVLPHDAWGMLGSARSEEELGRLLGEALEARADPPPVSNQRVFAYLEESWSGGSEGSGSGERIAEVVLAGGPKHTAGRTQPRPRAVEGLV